MTTVVFLGPSLPVARARALLPDAIYLPPVAQGDLVTAVRRYRPTVVALVDGTFGQTLSVWHKEILWALGRGVRVFGASSMGALRAAECGVFGMEGVGQVHRWYADGDLTGDDEVALVHAPDADEGYRAFTEPLVTVRATLRAGVRDGVLGPEAHDLALDVARSLFYGDRTVRSLLLAAERAGMGAADLAALEECLRHRRVDVKRDDAVELLRTLADPEGLPPAPAPVAVTPSHVFEAMLARDRRVVDDGTEVTLEAISAHAAVHDDAFTRVQGAGLDRQLVTILAEMLGVELQADEVAAEHQRFRRRMGLADEDQVRAWCAENDLEEAELAHLVHELAVRRRMHAWVLTRNYKLRAFRPCLDEARVTGCYPRWRAAAAAQQAAVGTATPEELDDGADLSELVRSHHRATGWRPDTDLATWARESGFGSADEVVTELRASRLARARRAEAVSMLMETL